jgi:hypothetical protein
MTDTMCRESENSSSGVVRDPGARVAHAPKDLPAEKPVDEQARRDLLRAQGAFMKAKAEGRIPADAKFPYEEFSRASGPGTSPDIKPMKKHRRRGSDLVPVACLLILGWGVEIRLPKRFVDFLRRPPSALSQGLGEMTTTGWGRIPASPG